MRLFQGDLCETIATDGDNGAVKPQNGQPPENMSELPTLEYC